MSYFTAELGHEVRRQTAHIIAARFQRENERMAKMGRLNEKFEKAGGVVQRSEKLIEEKLDHLIAREDSVATRTERIFELHQAPLDEAEAALDALESKLDLLSNGGPSGPLPGSGSSPEVEQAATTFQAAVDPEATDARAVG